MSARLTGSRELLNKIKRFGGDAEKAEKRAVYLTANAIKNSAVKSINKQSFGKVVNRQKQGGKGTYKHVASKAGDAPNTDTSDLVKSISVEPLQPKKTMYVGVNAEHGTWLEFGTRDMKARPFMQPAMDENENELMELLAQEFRKLLR